MPPERESPEESDRRVRPDAAEPVGGAIDRGEAEPLVQPVRIARDEHHPLQAHRVEGGEHELDQGHTEPVEITGVFTEPFDDPFGGTRLGLKLEAKVDRTKFGVSWNNPLPSGEPALSNEVTIIADLQLSKQA